MNKHKMMGSEETIPDFRYRCFLPHVGEALRLDLAGHRGINPLLLSHQITYDQPLVIENGVISLTNHTRAGNPGFVRRQAGFCSAVSSAISW
jgi:hypothetical protein